MSGNRLGGLKAAQTIKERYSKDFYAKIGRVGGQNGNTGGFYANRKLASEAGYKGGIVTGAQYKTRSKDATV